MPIVNLGTCCGSDAISSVPAWLEAGNQGIDTAYNYGAVSRGQAEKWVPGGLQTDIRAALQSNSYSGKDVFITTKLPAGLWREGHSRGCGDAHAGAAILYQVRKSLAELGVHQLDLVLLHAPCSNRTNNVLLWRGLEDALIEGSSAP